MRRSTGGLRKKRGFPIVVSAPSGTGKTTICRRVASSHPGVKYSVSATTRPRRKGEVDGEDYHFLDEETFGAWIKEGRFCEWALVYGHHYGTLKEQLDDILSRGYKAVMDLDVNGGEAIGELYKDAVLVYLLPPSPQALRQRLIGRGTDERRVIERRLEEAREELGRVVNYKYLVVNRSVESAVKQIESILVAEECRVERQDLGEVLSGLTDVQLKQS